MIVVLFPALIGAGLVALFVVGLATHATPWLTWLDGVAAALVIGALASRSGGRSTMNRGAILAFAAAALLVLWLVGVTGHATRWLVWWTFGTFLAVGLAAFDNGLDGLLDLARTSRARAAKAGRTLRSLGGERDDHNHSQEVFMYRGVAIALGLGLLVLWIAGLSYHAPVWLAWLDGVAGLIAFIVAWAFLASAMVGVAMSGGLALGLFVLWIIALGSRGGIWMAWWTFGFAAAFSLLAVAAMGGAASYHHHRFYRRA